MEAQPAEPAVSRREYMRDYQRERYSANKDKARGYQQSVKLKKKLSTSEGHWERYKHNLAGIVKLLKVTQHLSPELTLELVQSPPQVSLQ